MLVISHIFGHGNGFPSSTNVVLVVVILGVVRFSKY